ncbi:MAG: VOC family protein, partial [Actinomycetes bacterium]
MADLLTPRPAVTEPTVADLLLDWDHLEWWVGNARAVTAWLTSGFGFAVTAYAGPETGVGDRVSYLLEAGDIRFVVTAGLAPDDEVTDHVRRHGDGVRHVAWRVADPAQAFEIATRNGAPAVAPPTTLT